MTNRVLRLGGELPERADPWQWAIKSSLYRIGKFYEANHLSPSECMEILINHYRERKVGENEQTAPQ